MSEFKASHLPAPRTLCDADVVKALVRAWCAGDDAKPGLDDDDDGCAVRSVAAVSALRGAHTPSVLPVRAGCGGQLGSGGRGTGMSARQRCARLLCDYLRRFDGPLSGFALHHTAVSTMRSEFPAVALPPWLLEPLGDALRSTR